MRHPQDTRFRRKPLPRPTTYETLGKCPRRWGHSDKTARGITAHPRNPPTPSFPRRREPRTRGQKGAGHHSPSAQSAHPVIPAQAGTQNPGTRGRGASQPIRAIRVICGSDKKPRQNGTAAILAHPPIQPIPIQTTTTSVSATDALKPVIFADSLYFLNSTSQDFARNPLTCTAQLY